MDMSQFPHLRKNSIPEVSEKQLKALEEEALRRPHSRRCEASSDTRAETPLRIYNPDISWQFDKLISSFNVVQNIYLRFKGHFCVFKYYVQ